MAVDPDFAVALCSVELDANVFVTPLGRNVDRPPIPTNPAGQERASAAVIAVSVVLPLDAPIVRQVENPPIRIVEIDCLCAAHFAEMKTPIEIKLDGAAPSSRQPHRGAQQQ